MRTVIFCLLFLLFGFYTTSVVYAGHKPFTEGWYCENNNIMHDVPNASSDHELYEVCGNNRNCVEFNNPPYNRDAQCVTCQNKFRYNECVGCNTSRPVSTNSCTGAYVVGDNQNDPACSSWCSQTQPQPVGNCPVNSSCCSQPVQKCTANGKDTSCPAGFQWCYAGFCVNENFKPETNSCPAGITLSNVQCTSTLHGDMRSIVNAYRNAAGKPVWVTEVGFGTDDKLWQAEYLKRTFQVLNSQGVPVVIWYGWNDNLTGGDGQDHWGLFNSSGTIKPVGEAFKSFN